MQSFNLINYQKKPEIQYNKNNYCHPQLLQQGLYIPQIALSGHIHNIMLKVGKKQEQLLIPEHQQEFF